MLQAQTARQAIQTSLQQNAGVAATLTGSVSAPTERQPAVQRAQAALERAQLNLNYTVVRAAQDGIVTKVNQLQVGSYVSASKPVFTLASARLWVEGNFKEDQLNHMRVGQRATFKVDAFPDLRLTGRLATFSPGTGNSFSLLPAENATGNWVKVVQRLPVEFTIDQLPKDIPLHAGLSVEVENGTAASWWNGRFQDSRPIYRTAGSGSEVARQLSPKRRPTAVRQLSTRMQTFRLQRIDRWLPPALPAKF